MFESLENRTMLSGDFNTNPPPSQAVTPMANVTLATSKGRQTFSDTLSTKAMSTFQQTLSADATSPSPGISGLNSASTVMVASSAH